MKYQLKIVRFHSDFFLCELHLYLILCHRHIIVDIYSSLGSVVACSLCIAAYHHLDKTMEVSRVHLFDIITQYRAIFSDDEPIMRSHSHHSERNVYQPGLLHSWVIQKVRTSSAMSRHGTFYLLCSGSTCYLCQCMKWWHVVTC